MAILGGQRPERSTSQRVQRAVEVTAMHYLANARIDVRQRLRVELATRGVSDVDEEWVERTAESIRAGRPLDEP